MSRRDRHVIVLSIVLVLAACHVPPTRRSHTEYAVETPRSLSDADWELVSARCGEGRPLSQALLSLHVHVASEGDELTLTVKRSSLGCSEELVLSGKSLCEARDTCSRDLFVLGELKRTSQTGACDQMQGAPHVVRLTQSERTMTWVTSLDGLCGGVPALLSFEPALHEE